MALAREQLGWQYAGVARKMARELFHYWFGDYVTCESGGNLTVNGSMANFNEILWAARADFSLRNPANYTKPLVRFACADKEDLFDNVTWQKGGSILNMLWAYYLGEKVFFSRPATLPDAAGLWHGRGAAATAGPGGSVGPRLGLVFRPVVA